MGQYAEALAELREIKDVDPAQAASLYLTMGYAAAHLKQEKEAREYAEEARRWARRPEEQASVEALLRDLQRSAVTQAPTETTEPDDPGRPILRRRAPGSAGQRRR